MIDFFLRNAGGKMKALARLTIFLSILARWDSFWPGSS